MEKDVVIFGGVEIPEYIDVEQKSDKCVVFTKAEYIDCTAQEQRIYGVKKKNSGDSIISAAINWVQFQDTKKEFYRVIYTYSVVDDFFQDKRKAICYVIDLLNKRPSK